MMQIEIELAPKPAPNPAIAEWLQIADQFFRPWSAPMRFTYEVKNGMYIYKGPRGHGGIAYSLDQVKERLTKAYGGAGYELIAV